MKLRHTALWIFLLSHWDAYKTTTENTEVQ